MPLGYFTDSTPLTPLRNPFNVLVDAVNANETAISDAKDVRQIQTFRWADATERSSQTGMVAGDVGYQVDTGVQYIYNSSAWTPASGMAQIPSSVTVGSGSSSVAADGLVSFAGASTVSLNGVFDDPSGIYEVVVVALHSTSGTVFLRMRGSGADVTTNYSYVFNVTQLSAGPVRSSSSGASGFGFIRSAAGGATGELRARYTVFTPRAAATTTVLEGASASVYNGDRYHVEEMGAIGNPSGFDGLSIIASAGTMTGTVKVRKI